jgi:diadenosine tetraphosphate (Ap4A) HIT family hydrolase
MNKKNYRKRPTQCYFCHPEKGKKLMKKVYKYDVTFFGTWDNFILLPMIGAGIDGYVLIFHKNHFHSMAEIPQKDIINLKKLIKIIKKEINNSYGPSVVFEHGSTCDNISCLIDHAHIHIVPVPKRFDIKEEIQKDFPLLPLKKFTDIKYWSHGGLGQLHYQISNGTIDEKIARKKYHSFSGYLYYEDASENMFIHELKNLDSFQPQYIRMILFKKLGREKWEWNKNIDSECQKRTMESLKGLFKYLQPFEYEDDQN